MKNVIFLLFFALIVQIVVSKQFQNGTHTNKTHSKKNSTQRAYLIRTNLTKEDIEQLLNQTNVNNTSTNNGLNISEVDDDMYPEELDVEIEDEIMDNYTKPLVVDFLEKECNVSEAKSFIVMNNEKNIKKGILKKFLPWLSIIIFIYAMIYLNNLKKNNKVVKRYQFIDFDLKEDYLISKSD